MQLVTFTVGSTPQRTGALVEGGRKVLDLQAAYGRTYHGSSPVLENMLRIITAGDEARFPLLRDAPDPRLQGDQPDPAAGLVRAADLLPPEPLLCGRHRERRALARLLRDARFRARVR